MSPLSRPSPPPASAASAPIPACAGCGACCHLVVGLRAGDAVPADLVVEHGGARCLDQRGDGACIALDPLTHLCSIYDRRPQTCRDFQRGSALCRAALGRFAARPPQPAAPPTSPFRPSPSS